MSAYREPSEIQAAREVLEESIAKHGPVRGVQLAIADGESLGHLGRAMSLHANKRVLFNVTIGSSPYYGHALASAISMEDPGYVRWLSFRNAQKDHGTERVLEGTRPHHGDRILVVDAIARITGLRETCKSLRSTIPGIMVTGVMPLVAMERAGVQPQDRIASELRKVCPSAAYRPLFALTPGSRLTYPGSN